MATLTKFPCFLSLSPHKLFLNQPEQCQLCLMITHGFTPQKRFRIYACSAKKPRRSRKVKSNLELCNDIREFVSIVGFPEGYVPSMKEFSDNGRTDLGNIVRRRGYKYIRELLANTPKGEIHGLNEEDSLAEGKNAVSGVASLLTGQEEKAKDMATVSLSSGGGSIVEDHLADDFESRVDNSSFVAPSYTMKESDESVKHVFEENSMSLPSYVESNSVINSLSEEKVAKFIQNGVVDVDEEGNIHRTSHESSTDDVVGLEKAEKAAIETTSASTSNGSIVASEYDTSPVTENPTLGSDRVSAESEASFDIAKDLDIETRKMENRLEINQLKLMLHEKELELLQLKNQIEKEKLALAALQENAAAEMNRAQRLISEKDAELQAAEETLSGLVEVEIQYSGDAETVVVAGSFNGWHHPIELEPQPFASMADSVGSRKSLVWSTMLWLYPGEYEIKFIVDGHWKIDPQMEKVNKGGISNNILRVDR